MYSSLVSSDVLHIRLVMRAVSYFLLGWDEWFVLAVVDSWPELLRQEISVMAWAFATLNFRHQALLGDYLRDQAVSIFLNAAATFNIRPCIGAGSSSKEALGCMPSSACQALSCETAQTATICHNYQQPSSKIPRCSEPEGVPEWPRSEFGELEISNTAWAFARIAVRNDRREPRADPCWSSPAGSLSCGGWWIASLMLPWLGHALELVLEQLTASRASPLDSETLESAGGWIMGSWSFLWLRFESKWNLFDRRPLRRFLVANRSRFRHREDFGEYDHSKLLVINWTALKHGKSPNGINGVEDDPRWAGFPLDVTPEPCFSHFFLLNHQLFADFFCNMFLFNHHVYEYGISLWI